MSSSIKLVLDCSFPPRATLNCAYILCDQPCMRNNQNCWKMAYFSYETAFCCEGDLQSLLQAWCYEVLAGTPTLFPIPPQSVTFCL